MGWSRAVTPVPGDPALREQVESRDTEAALRAIDGQLEDLQVSVAQPFDEGKLRQLLFQAVQETAPPRTADKVLALTSQPALGNNFDNGPTATSLALFDRVAPVSVGAHCMKFPENVSLCRARQILKKLHRNDDQWEDIFVEAETTLQQLEMGIKNLDV